MFKSRLVTHLLGRGRHHYYVILSFMLIAILFSFLTPTPVNALPAGFQEYLVMGDEYQIYRMFNSIGFSATQEMSSIVTIVATSSGQQIYYDHWEDGYEVNIFSPVMTSTLIFGDGNTTNGDSGHGSDLLNQGTVLSLKSYDPSGDAGNLITDTIDVSAPRDVTEIRYDSRDRIVTTGGPVNVVHAVWPYNETYIGGSWEIYSFQAWRNGTFYTIPIGENSYSNNGGDTGPFADFRDVWLQVQAAEDNTSVTVDNGQDTPVSITLNQGETYTSLGYKNGDSVSSIQILEGTTINTDKPVQAGLVTASDGSYQTRFFAMIPDVVWGTEYLVPVASSTDTDGHSQVYLFNPNDFDISVSASDRHPITSTGTITIPANSARAYSQPPPDGMGHVVPGDEASHPDNSAARLVSNHIFWAIGSHSFSEINYDWGYSLIPVNFLTSDYYVSWAPGNSNIPPSSGGAENGSPVHVTPRDDNTTFYVDYGPTDGEIDRTFTLDTLERELIIDPGDDLDNTGMHIWTDNKPFMAVWGETPDYAETSTPYLDLGTTILPLYHGWLDPILSVDKTANPQTLPSVGGVVNFALDVASYDKILENTDVTDTLPYGWSYVNDSTTITYPNGTTANLNPTINGQNLVWDLNQDLHLNENLQITFDAQVSGLGSSVTEDWETGTYTGGMGWTGDWIETDSTGNSQDPGTGGVQVVQEPSDAHSGEWHLWLRGNGATSQAISRTVDLSDFVNPALDFWRLVDNVEASDYFYLDISHNGGITWTRVITFVEDENEGTYVNHRVSLVDYQSSNTAIRFTGSPNNSSYDDLYIDDLQILDTATINRNVGIAAGTYMNNLFEASDEAFVYISDLSLDKTVDKDEAPVGEEIVYTLSYTNSGAVTTTNTYIRDVIPVNTTFTGQASAGGTYNTSNNAIVWDLGEVAPSHGGVVTFSVTLNRVPDGTVVENSATIDSAETAESTSNVVQTTILAPALSLSKSAPTTAAAGDTVTYTIDYANTGGASATGVIISDTIPANTTYVTGSIAIDTGSGWIALTDVADGDAGHWNGTVTGVAPGVVSGTLDPGESGQIRFAVTIDTGTPEGTGIGNVAKVDSDQTNPQSSNMATTNVSPLTIDKAADRAVATAGEIVEFTVTYENKGDLTLNDIYLIDAIPENTTLVSGTVTGAGVSVEYSTDNGQNWASSFADPANVTDIRWSRTTLISQTQETVGFQARLDDPLPGNTTIRNEARITSTETAASGWLYSNEVSIGTVDLSIAKVPNAEFVRDGDTITYTITYGNGGSAAASSATIVDEVPENTTYVDGSITGAGADDGDPARLVWHLGTIPANSGGYKASFVVEVDAGTAPGTSIHNTATLTDAYDSASSGVVQVTVAEDGVTISPDRSDNGHDQGEEVCYAHTVRNTGQLSDTMELSATHSVWTGAAVSFYQDNNLNGERDAPDTALTDTNTSGSVDTGELEPDQQIRILACFTIPTAGVDDGDTDVLTVQATAYASAKFSQVQDTTTVKVYNFIDLTSPADGLITHTTYISVSGTTNPNASVVITNTATGMTYTVTADGTGNFATAIALIVGANPLEVMSTDGNGDAATATSTVTLTSDSTHAGNSLTITNPDDGSVTSTTTISVTGETDPGSTVTVTNTATGAIYTTIADNSGNFTITAVAIVSGTNALEALSTDPFGNPATDNVTVMLDTTPDANSLTITSPDEGAVTSTTSIPVLGTTDPGSTVTVTNTATGQTFTTTADNDGNFSVVVDLTDTEDDNPLTVTSTDPFGQTISKDITVIKVLPTLLIGKAADDLNGPPLFTGDLIRYTIHITNDSAITHTGVTVTDTLPSGVEFVSATPAGYTATATDVVWQVGDLPAGETWAATITFTVVATDTIGPNVAAVSSDQQNAQETDPVYPNEDGEVEDNSICVCDPDSYEPNDDAPQAGSLLIGYMNKQTHNFCDDAVDWIAFTVQAGNIYTITTSSWGQRADTFLTLFDTDGKTQLQANDDYEDATDHSSRIVWQAPADGVYYIRVTNQAQLTGCETQYDVWIEVEEKTFIYLPLVTRNHGTARAASQNTVPSLAPLDITMAPMGIISHTCPDNNEIDDTWQQANPIESNVVQTHTLDSDPIKYAADKDFVYFDLAKGQTITVTVTPTDGLETVMMLHDSLGSAMEVTGTTQIVWTPPDAGRYYLSVGPRDESAPFGCYEVAGYDLFVTMAERNVIYLPLVTRNF